MSVKKNRFYKYCIVPGCKNTTFTTPSKLFIHVPRVASLRKKWWKAIRKDPNTKNNVPLSTKSTRFCCEDHFDLKNDMQNYLKWKMMGGNVLLKKGVVPHIFDCQNSTDSIKKPTVERSAAGHIPLLNDTYALEKAIQGSSSQIDWNLIQCGSIKLTSNSLSDNGFRNVSQLRVYSNKNKARRKESMESQQTRTTLSRVNSPTERSGSCMLSPPLKLSDEDLTPVTAGDHRSLDYHANEIQSLSEPGSNFESDPENQFEAIMLTGTMMSIQKDPKLYLGISTETYFCLDTLCHIIPCDHKDILITLKMIRLNEPYAILAMQFATSATTIEAVFQRTVSLMSKYFKELIYWSTSTNVLEHLPVIFRARYSNVCCMLDILEVKIQKPDNPLHERLTWSKDRNCYTTKYIISCTPDGLITYTSNGFGGQTSDANILESCGLLEKLSPGMDIITERSLKNVDHLLAQRSCKLIILPTVRENIPRSKEDVVEFKRIESLRLYVQSVSGRLRNFKMLTLHTHVDSKFTSMLDDVVVIVSGLINLQNSFNL